MKCKSKYYHRAKNRNQSRKRIKYSKSKAVEALINSTLKPLRLDYLLELPLNKHIPRYRKGSLISDIVIESLKLIIEIDGLEHRYWESLIKDWIKDEVAVYQGYTVFRFSNKMCITDMGKIQKILLPYLMSKLKNPAIAYLSYPEDQINMRYGKLSQSILHSIAYGHVNIRKLTKKIVDRKYIQGIII